MPKRARERQKERERERVGEGGENGGKCHGVTKNDLYEMLSVRTHTRRENAQIHLSSYRQDKRH